MSIKYRGFNDINAQRQAIYDSARDAIGSMPKLENATHALDITDIGYDDDEYKPTKAEQKQAILAGRSLHRPLKATITLRNKLDNTPIESQRVTMVHVPHLDDRGLFVRKGVLWNVRNQLRLRPGVYTRVKNNGRVETHFNTEAKSAPNFRIELNPESGEFRFNIGQSTTRLYPLLKAAGVTDDEMKATWGEELYNANFRSASGHDLQDLKKVVGKLSRQEFPDDLLVQGFKDSLARAKVDPDSTELTIGRRIKNVSISDLLAATSKILKVTKGEELEDNRDSQAFQTLHSTEDFIKERLGWDQKGKLRRLLFNASKNGSLGKIFSGLLDDNIKPIFEDSGLNHAVEDVNPLEIYDQRQGITRLGEGGMSSERVASKESRGVQPSYLGIIDAVRGPESSRLGLDLRTTDVALKGNDNQIHAKVINNRTGKQEILSARTLSQSVLAFPNEMNKGLKRVAAVKDDKIIYANREDVDYIVPTANSMFSGMCKLIPFAESIKGQRLLMGSRFAQQALPLIEPEAPYVQTADDDGQSYYKKLSPAVGAVYADAPGKVVKVTPDEITVLTAAGKKTFDLYNNYPSARKTSVHNSSSVKVGDIVKPGQLLARSNLTDADGTVAFGRNLRCAFAVAEGGTLEDAIVVSETAAKKLAAETLNKVDLDLTNVKSTDKKQYQAIFTDKYKPEQYANIDKDGIVKIGAVVRPGDPLILAINDKPARAVGALMKTPRSTTMDKTCTWDKEVSGVVTDTNRTRGGVIVTVKSTQPLLPGNKLCNRYASKGVVSEVRPDDQMPMDAEGKPIEIIINALGIISRTNPAALAESLLGKVAEKTGKRYVIKNFDTPNVAEFALQEALNAGVIKKDAEGKIIDTEELTDPRDGRKLQNIFTGNTYIMQLHHTAGGKLSARDVGSYTTEGMPARGSHDGSKRIGILDLYSLISAGATDFLKDAKLIRGQRNDDYWRALRHGETPVAPQESFANDEFKQLLTAAGVRLREKGTRTGLAPMLDADVNELAKHEIKNTGTFNFETMQPVPGGLFDLAATGGNEGNKFSKIRLPVKVPHPLFREPIYKILGLKGKDLTSILSGEMELNKQTGPAAIEAALGAVNVDREITTATEEVRSSSKTRRDEAVKRLGCLLGLKRMGVKPQDLMVETLPVIPPKYRPIIRGEKLDVIHDLNKLYHDVLEAKENYTQAKDTFGEAPKEYNTLLHAVDAVVGLREPVDPKSVEQGVKGILTYALGVGDSPKESFYQRKVIGTAVDTVGRGVITADPNLDMDEVGIPVEMAWKIFRPWIVRGLVLNGYPATEALKAVKDRTAEAKSQLLKEMSTRPVVYNRAPALHRYNYTGAYAKLRDDHAIGMPYQTLKGAGADYDGDSALTSTLTSSITPVGYVAGGYLYMPLTSDHKVLTLNGVVPLSQFPKLENTKVAISDTCDEYDVPAGIKVFALDRDSHEHREYEVTKVSVHKNVDMRLVTLGSRAKDSLFISADHSLVVYDNNQLQLVKPDEAVGKCVPILKHIQPEELTNEVNIVGVSRHRSGTPGVRGLTHTVEVPIDWTFKLDRDFGFILGALIGDGWVDCRDRIYLAANVESVRASFISAMNRVFGDKINEPSITEYDAESLGEKITHRVKISYGCKVLAEFLKESIGEGAFNKHIPIFALNASKECLAGILDGLLSTDGSVSINTVKIRKQLIINFATSSLQLIDDLQFICRRLGIYVSVSKYKSRISDKDAFILSLSTVDMKRFVNACGFTISHDGKQQILKDIDSLVNEDSAVAGSMDLVPYPQQLHLIVTNLARLFGAARCSDSSACSAADKAAGSMVGCKKSGYLSRNLMNVLINGYKTLDTTARQQLIVCRGNRNFNVTAQILDEFDKYIKLISDTSIFWKPIMSVEKIAATEAYDLTVPGPYTFATSTGVIVQDTINIHVPVSKEAVADVKDTLLPSKNLLHTSTFETHMEPMQDYLIGLYLATKPDLTKAVKVFNTVDEAKKAFARGEISARTPIRIKA